MPVRRLSSLLLTLALAGLTPHGASAQPAPVSAWPLRINTDAGQLSIYQPQPDSFEGDQLSARSAVSLVPPGATEPEFGATWFKARVLTDRDARTVTIQDMDVGQVKLPNSPADQEAGFAAVIKGQLPQMHVTFSLDQLEDSLSLVQKARVESQQLDNAPPKIIVTQTPTTLVVLDGEPRLQPADGVPGVMRVVNTPFILLLDAGSKQYFLKAGSAWLAAPDVTGAWRPVASVPDGIAQEGSKLSVANQSAPDQQPAAAPAPANAGATQIVVAEEPTELISSDGPPQYTPLPGNDLLYMSNTQSDVFLEVATQKVFVLLSGRWYVGPNLNGPWQFVAADALPPAFAQIPESSPKGYVLASVAGTQRAQEARMDAYVPQTTAVHRDAGSSLTVTYDGDPQFVPVADGSPLTYASNCADPVVRTDNTYYCCHQAVWYQSTVAVGPWVVCTAVPQVIYTIPPACPIYSCRYVYVYDSTPDVVYCGYLPGYTGCYVYGPTIVYGTGYNYPFWYHREFIPRPYTWGFAPRYDYYSATWGFGVGRPYDRTWFAAGPAMSVRHDWWGPSGYVDYHEIHQSRTTIVNNYYGGRGDVRRDEIRRGPAVINNARNTTINNINIYNRQENAPRNVYVNNSRATNFNNNGRNGNGRDATVNHGPAFPPDRGTDRGANDVYAGRDGQVYRRTDQGWQQRSGNGWSQVNGVPEARPANEGAPSQSGLRTTRGPSNATPDDGLTHAAVTGPRERLGGGSVTDANTASSSGQSSPRQRSGGGQANPAADTASSGQSNPRERTGTGSVVQANPAADGAPSTVVRSSPRQSVGTGSSPQANSAADAAPSSSSGRSSPRERAGTGSAQQADPSADSTPSRSSRSNPRERAGTGSQASSASDNSGLEADHSARERGAARSSSSDDDAPAPAKSSGSGNSAPRNNGGGGGGGGGSSGGGGKGGGGGGGNNKGH
jgi:hypothetical protein